MWTLLLQLLLVCTLVAAQNCIDASQSTSLNTTQPSVLFRKCTVNSSSVITVNTNTTSTATVDYATFVGDSYLHITGTTDPPPFRVTIDVVHSSFLEAGVKFSGNFSTATLTLRNNVDTNAHH